MTDITSRPKVLFITTAHLAWGNAHALRTLGLAQQFPTSVVLDIVLEDDPYLETFSHHSKAPVSEVSSTSFIKIKWPVTHVVIRSMKEFQKWWTKQEFSLVVIDRREPPPKIIKEIRHRKIPVIAFDICSNLSVVSKNKGGLIPKKTRDHYQTALENITYVINAIPSLEDNWANLNGWAYLFSPAINKDNLKKNSKSNKKKIEQGIVWYWGSFMDSHYLTHTLKSIHDLFANSYFCHYFPNSLPIYVLASNRSRPLVKKILELDLRSKQFDYRFLPVNPDGIEWQKVKLLFTHFGLLGLESISRKIPTFFLEPTEYHTNLAEKHFPELLLTQVVKRVKPCSMKSKKKIVDMLEVKNPIVKIGKIGKEWKRILDIIQAMANYHHVSKKRHITSLGNSCELCGNMEVIKHRRSWMNLSMCSSCGSYRLRSFVSKMANRKKERILWGAPCEDYDGDYFISEYKKSYGHSYQEDEIKIKDLSKLRMKVIKQLWVKKKKMWSSPRLLDIGCAYGFFLDVAAESGCLTYGVDVSSHAGKQIKSRHHFILGDFQEDKIVEKFVQKKKEKKYFSPTDKKIEFDVVTLWYVIEHFTNVHPIIKKISELQGTGGILGLSTPNSQGLSARYRNQLFLKTSPSDHYYIFSLLGLRKLLSSYGYEFLTFRASGIHYSRFQSTFPRLSSWIPSNLYHKWASLTNNGDTMEVYFRKL